MYLFIIFILASNYTSTVALAPLHTFHSTSSLQHIKTQPDNRTQSSTLFSATNIPHIKLFTKYNRLPQPIQFTLLLNVLIYVCWQIFPLDRMYRLFANNHRNSNFYVNKKIQIFTQLSSMFSHTTFLHLLMNMKALIELGPTVVSSIGTKGFITLFMITAVISNLLISLSRSFSLTFCSKYQQFNDKNRPIVGFSGINCALIALFTVTCSHDTYLTLPIVDSLLPPLPPIVFLKYLLLFDTIGLMLQSTFISMPLCHSAHLGGYVSGLLYYVLFVGRKVHSVSGGWRKLCGLFQSSGM